MNKGEIFHTHHMIHRNGHLIFWANALQKMMDIDINSGVLKLLFSLNDTDVSRVFEYYDGRYYLFESFKNAVSIYDVDKKKETRNIMPSDIADKVGDWELFAFRHENDVYISGNSPIIVDYNMKINKWRTFRCDNIDNMNGKKLTSTIRFPFLYKGCVYYLFSGNPVKFMVINCNNNSVDFIDLDTPDTIQEIATVTGYKDNIYVYAKNKDDVGEIYSAIIDDVFRFEKISEIDKYNASYLLIPTTKKLYMTPCRCDVAYEIDLENHVVNKDPGIPVTDSIYLGDGYASNYNYICGVDIDDTYYTIHPWTQSLLAINRISGNITITPIQISNEEYLNINGENVLYEEKLFNFKDFMRFFTDESGVE